MPAFQPLLFLGFGGNVDRHHRPFVAQDITLELVGQVTGIELVGLNSLVLGIELLGVDDKALDAHGFEFARGPETERARLIDGIDLLGQGGLLLHEHPKLVPGKLLPRLRS